MTFCERDLFTKIQQQIHARHNGDIQVSTDHEKKLTIENNSVNEQVDKSIKEQELTPKLCQTQNITITLLNEDHTLGNILREKLMARKDVYTAGYVIPHPLEQKMKFFIQSYSDGRLILQEELERISRDCESLSNAIDTAIDSFSAGR